MKKRISPTALITPSVNADSFKTAAELPTAQAVNDAVSEVTKQPMTPEKMGEVVTRIMSEPKAPQSRNERKRETIKGTILQSVMIDIELLKKVKHNAFYNEKSISEVINQALRLYFD